MYINLTVDEENINWLIEKLESPNEDPTRDEWFIAAVESINRQIAAQMLLKRGV